MTTNASDASAAAALEVAFHPKSIAVAGVSPGRTGWGGGLMFYRSAAHFGRVERAYAINPKGGELADGSPIYTSLAEIPGDVDLVISAVPASAILGLIDDAVAKGVKVIHSFTAGFAETGDEDRVELEAQMLAKLRAGGIRLIGPNCMGIHSPIAGVSWMDESSTEVGRVALASQSGMHASEIVRLGEQRAVRFSYAVSYGNASDLNESDYLDYFADNDETDVVLAYLEGVKDGPRFLRTARRLAAKKPLIVLKGGLTEAGSRAASSHTGSLAGSAQIWEAVRRQANFISVLNTDELLDAAITVQHLRALAGPRVAVVGGGGGTSVLAADACGRLGIPVPWLTEATQRTLGEHTPVAGTSVRNPVDSNITWNQDHFQESLATIAADSNIDWLLLHFGLDAGPGVGDPSERRQFEDRMVENIREASTTLSKPLAVAIRPPSSVSGMEADLRIKQELGAAGVAVYPSVEACALAVRRFLDWRAASD
ncbi:MAG: CoA-binding protein [Chloroflexi bacterium]|nr:CoA-binding protein [Chloroflexota bacterium]